jgi:diaminopimelate decarboxylase
MAVQTSRPVPAPAVVVPADSAAAAENTSSSASASSSTGAQLHHSTVWGPSCDSADCVLPDVQLPQLQLGDWLMFPQFGAYSVPGASHFNGISMDQPAKVYVCSDNG